MNAIGLFLLATVIVINWSVDTNASVTTVDITEPSSSLNDENGNNESSPAVRAQPEEEPGKIKTREVAFFWTGIGLCFALVTSGVDVCVWWIASMRRIRRRRKRNDKLEAELEAEGSDDSISDTDAEVKRDKDSNAIVGEQQSQLLKVKMNQSLKIMVETTPALSGYEELRKKLKSTSDMPRERAVEKIVKPLREALRKVDGDAKSVNLMSSPNFFRPQISVRKDSQAVAKVEMEDGKVKQRPLNLNGMKDFMNHKIFLGQPPGEKQSDAEYWQFIWKEEVGVVVWIGTHTQGDAMYFRPYVRFHKNKVIAVGSFLYTTLLKAVRLSDRVVCYHVLFEVSYPMEKRRMLIFHIDSWPAWDSANAASLLINACTKAHTRVFQSKPQRLDGVTADYAGALSDWDLSIGHVRYHVHLPSDMDAQSRNQYTSRGRVRQETSIQGVGLDARSNFERNQTDLPRPRRRW